MKIVVLALGTRGDVQPFLALGAGLRAAGYDVRIATHQRFEPLVSAAGLEFAPMAGDPQALLATQAGKELVNNDGRGLLHSTRRTIQMMEAEFEQGFRDCLAAAEGADALIVSPTGLGPAHPLSEVMGIPLIRCFYGPGLPTGERPAFDLPFGWNPGRRINLLTYDMLREALWLAGRRPMNKHVRPRLGLAPLPLQHAMNALDRSGIPVLNCYSPVAHPRPADWPANFHVTGWWFVDRPATWAPPQELVDFLAGGPQPISIGFGSMPGFDPEQLLEIVRGGLRRSGQRGILLGNWSGLSAADDGMTLISDDLLLASEIPHDWLFPRMAANIHHGGAGTTGGALRAGVPTAMVPFLPDQRMWGRQVAKLGVGAEPLPPKQLSADSLADLITVLQSNGALRERAAEIGARIAAEDGVGNAVRVLTDYFDTHRDQRPRTSRPAALLAGNPSGRRVPLSLAEQLFVRTDAPSEPGTMHLEIRVSGRLDEQRLDAAAAAAARAHVMTRMRLAPATQRRRLPHWEEIELHDGGLVEVAECPQDADGTAMDRIRARFYSTPLDTSAAPLLRLLLVRRPGGDSLLLSVHHAVMDGLGMARYLQSVGRAYAGVPDPMSDVDPLACRDLAATFGEHFPAQPGGKAFRTTGKRKRAQLDPQVARPAAGFGFVTRKLPLDWPTPEAAHKDLRGARGEYAMIAALHRAVERWNRARGVPVDLITNLLPISVRLPEWGLDVVANLVMAGHVFTSPEQRGTDRELLAAVTEQVRRIRSGADFGAALRTPRWIRRYVLPGLLAVAGPRLVDTAAIMTNVGAADGIYDFGPDAGEIIEALGSPPTVMPMGVGICASTLYGDVSITLRYCRALFDEPAAAEFAALYLDCLEKFSLQQRRSVPAQPQPAEVTSSPAD
jgi:UDP:flavonoid glycosyltransferase YjiC (YdhE family)